MAPHPPKLSQAESPRAGGAQPSPSRAGWPDPHGALAGARLVLLLLALTSCLSLERLGDISPLGGEAGTERVNLWPLYYKDGDATAVLWPLFDVDDEGFALRPLVTHQDTAWELVPPLVWFDAETGHFFAFPAYHFQGVHGLFPILGFGDLSWVGPIWWTDSSGGVFPIAAVGGSTQWIGPVWWRGADASWDGWGVFPLVSMTEGIKQLGPVAWSRDPQTGAGMTLVAPLWFAWQADDGERLWLTPLGGRGLSADGERGFVNVLGPVYHREFSPAETTHHVLWPLIESTRGDIERTWHAFPLAGHVRNHASGDARTWLLSGLVEWTSDREDGDDDLTSLRAWPLFSVHGDSSPPPDFLHFIGLVGVDRRGSSTEVHVGTPLLFQYAGGPGEGDEPNGAWHEWSALLGAVHAESAPERSRFELLWYLYRRQTEGARTKRDLFPFLSYDTDDTTPEGASDFSFLWRLLHVEREGDDYSGHILFIPFD